MRKVAALGAVAAAYLLLFGFMALLVIAVTAAISDGWALRQAAERHVDESPRFSPDGAQIAWIRRDDKGAELWVMASDGSNQQPIAGATRFRWARRGGALLFSHGGPHVFLVAPDGSAPVDAGRAQLARGTTGDESRGRRVFSRGHRLYLRLRDGTQRALT
jgi:hypothetical protein